MEVGAHELERICAFRIPSIKMECNVYDFEVDCGERRDPKKGLVCFGRCDARI
jgi:hypothetical protein